MSLTSKPCVFLILTSAACLYAKSVSLSIVNTQLNPDGFGSRSTVVGGGTFPRPLISGNKGDNF
ncbi:hypothetical protein NEOLEDRAFT_1142644 [Neolentinus lepideus HHB14362 ss-1]|uniref:Uncharacterized protein n=1 Tax=Neolentinus lepideus HHB14362 ss-1 TaxID=1314782 RepID=A0A165N1C3_9AGAM|nr:hypothetical protein NEOLEDRAFT_1142644 [Neolentinus lepideus HHB14362 ss-1]